MKWVYVKNDDSDDEIKDVDSELSDILNEKYDDCLDDELNLAHALKINGIEHILYFDFSKKEGKRPIIINM